MKILKYLGVFGSIRLAIQFLISRICFPNARIIRYPFSIRREGVINIGVGFSSNSGLVIETFGETSVIEIGVNVYANYRLHIGACDSIIIGENTLFGSDCLIIDHSHGGYDSEYSSDPFSPPVRRKLISSPIKIGANCWLGDRVSVLPGVTIGDGCIVGVGSVVTKNLPAYTLSVGSPARVIKRYDFDSGVWITFNEF